MRQKVIAVVNQKGGVGKTTTAINVAAYLTAARQNVLLIDADPQANATSGLGLPKEEASQSLYEIMVEKRAVATAIKHTHVPRLFVLPSAPALAGLEVSLVSQPEREFLLKKALVDIDFGVVIIDCPPSLGLMTINALTAADYVLIPVQTEYYALEGLSQLLNTLQAVRSSTNPNLELLGIILTMYDRRNSLSAQVEAEVGQYFGDKLFKTEIPRNVRLAEAPSFGRTIIEHDHWSKGARAYKALTKEIQAALGE